MAPILLIPFPASLVQTKPARSGRPRRTSLPFWRENSNRKMGEIAEKIARLRGGSAGGSLSTSLMLWPGAHSAMISRRLIGVVNDHGANADSNSTVFLGRVIVFRGAIINIAVAWDFAAIGLSTPSAARWFELLAMPNQEHMIDTHVTTRARARWQGHHLKSQRFWMGAGRTRSVSKRIGASWLP